MSYHLLVEPGKPTKRSLSVHRVFPMLLLVAACGPGAAATTTSTIPDGSFVSRQADIETDYRVVELEDGTYVGYFQWVSPDGMTGGGEIHFDLAVWFSGEDADRAAIEDLGAPPDGEQYYIRNLDPSQLVLEVADRVSVTSVWYHYSERGIDQGVPITFEQLAAIWADTPDDFRANLRNSPWWITIVDGQVVAIDEQYVP